MSSRWIQCRAALPWLLETTLCSARNYFAIAPVGTWRPRSPPLATGTEPRRLRTTARDTRTLVAVAQPAAGASTRIQRYWEPIGLARPQGGVHREGEVRRTAKPRTAKKVLRRHSDRVAPCSCSGISGTGPRKAERRSGHAVCSRTQKPAMTLANGLGAPLSDYRRPDSAASIRQSTNPGQLPRTPGDARSARSNMPGSVPG